LLNQRVAFTSEAGGANLIHDLLLSMEDSPVVFYSQGVSRKILRNLGIRDTSIGELIDALSKAKDVYVALGNPAETKEWFGILEDVSHPAQKIYGVLDNWVNYEMRIAGFPVDELIVFDEYARVHLNSILPGRPVSLKRNYYLARLEKDFHDFRREPSKVLLLGGRENEYSIPLYPPIHAEHSCVCMQIMNINRTFPAASVSYRPHPAVVLSSTCRDSDIVKHLVSAGLFEISDPLKSLGKELAGVSVVFGPHSYALYVSQELGLDTYATTVANEKWHGPKFKSFAGLG